MKRLQMLLGVEPADGIFGNDTEKAVISFQSAHGLTPDGIVGSLTWAALEKNRATDKPVIILGTAHGSNTLGKRSPDGRLREYAWSREVVSMIETELKAKGYHVEVDLRQDYEPGLALRVSIVNNLCTTYGVKNCLYVSVHVNAAGMGDKWMTAGYWTVWTSRGQTKGDVLAARLWKAAHDLMPSSMPVKADWRDGDADYESNFYVLAKTNCPACLTENLFQDNKANVDWLLSDEGKKTITEVHVRGIEEYIKNDMAL